MNETWTRSGVRPAWARPERSQHGQEAKLASNWKCADLGEPVQSTWIEHFGVNQPSMCHIFDFTFNSAGHSNFQLFVFNIHH